MKVNDEKQELDPTDRVMKFGDMVNFEFKYPAEYKKANGQPIPKHFKDGHIEPMHRLMAEDFEKRKIGKIVK